MSNYILIFCMGIILALVNAKTPTILPESKEPIPILAYESDIDPEGNYHYSYESGDGSKAEQHGILKAIDEDTKAEVVEGSFQYEGPDGKTYSLNYVADENGFRPQGEHLPVAPEMPPGIVRALAYLATAPPPKDLSEDVENI